MPDSRTPPTGPRGRRASHARRNSIRARISRSVAAAPGKLESALYSTRRLGRRVVDAQPWKPATLRRIPRPRAIRAKVVFLLAIPIVSLMTLWGLAAVQAAQTVYTLTELKQFDAAVHAPTDNVISSLQRERIGVARLLGDPNPATPDATLTAAYTATDTAAGALRNGADMSAAAATSLGADVSGHVSSLLTELAALPALRGEAAKRQVTWATAQAGYTKAIEDALALDGGLAAVLDRSGQNGQAASDAWAVVDVARSREMLARQAAIVANAQAAGSGPAGDGYRQFAGAYYSQYELEQAALPQLRESDAAAYRAATSTADFQRLRAAQQTLLGAGDQGTNTAVNRTGTSANVAEAEDVWSSLAPTALASVGNIVTSAGTAAIAQIDPYSHALETKAGVGVLLGLIAVAVSLLVSVWIGRGLVLELVGLRDAALDLARRRLPRAIGRLRAGESVDLETEAQSVPFLSAVGFAGLAGASGTRASGAQDEVGEVAQALATVHRAALRAALDRAEAISGVSDVFVSLARRSQVLLHRQLELLDLMERRIDDTRNLEDLFRLDHMATRMRRHAEGLIILSGAAPGRGWRKPAPLMDVVRAAVAEVEDYARVDVRRLPDVYVTGAAIADLTHLLAELVENATVFSPPHTRVYVQGSMIGAGFAVQIEDRGLGMSFESLSEANRRIESARQDDVLDSDRLGLFVVSRLARRHGIRVMLQQSARGGTTAVVLLPQDLLEATSQETTSVTMITSARNAKAALGELEESALVEREAVLVSAGYANSNHVSAEPSVAEPSAPASHVTRPLNSAAHTRPEIPADRPAPENLPRRVRQANLAPGLRGEPTRQPGAESEDDGESTVRTPEQARTTMSAYQQGWSLGRAASESAAAPESAAADTDAGTGTGTADTHEQPVNPPTS